VVDLTQAWIGPFMTLMLADLGAEVIKVESHKRPDVWRQPSALPVPIQKVLAERVNRSHYFNSVNRNKRSLTLDLSSEQGRALLVQLTRDAHVIAENYSPKVMARWGLDHAALAQIAPDLVMISSSGFGQTGPWSQYRTTGQRSRRWLAGTRARLPRRTARC
jgi:crotonobetainyl-CoA:carnitine CoA-transferase CaiB-like acyl-CoA transferase